MRNKRVFLTIILVGLVISAPAGTKAQQARGHDDRPATLRFFGTPTAELFTREIDASFKGALLKDFVPESSNGLPAGFVNASPPGQAWAGTMWTRDSGTYIRELTMRGYYQQAALVAECLMNLVEKNDNGFYSFPRYFRGAQVGSGTEVDGTASIIIGMILLWQRLMPGDATRSHIQTFLLQNASPINYFEYLLQDNSLVAGTGEFGCGMQIKGECYNVVQNDLTVLALLAAANMTDEARNPALSRQYRDLAAKVWKGMETYLVDKDGTWIWCIDTKTLKPNPTVLEAKVNRGFGGVDGLGTMYADVLGFQAPTSPGKSPERSKKTLQRLYETPQRKLEFDQYGIWTQFDALADGMLTSPSYGQGYALQSMLLDDNFTMADKAVSFLANATYQPVPEYKLTRDSPYYFYERLYSPDAVGKVDLAVGCGALNLVNVTEPLKVSRIMLGVDDTSLTQVQIIPRIPSSWKGVEAHDWPVRTSRGVIRAKITFVKAGSGATFTIALGTGQTIDELRVRMPSATGFVWRKQNNVTSATFVTH